MGLVRLVLKMPLYCRVCNYACCGECPSKSDCVSPSRLCDGFPLVSSHQDYGFLGLSDWFIDKRCLGLGVVIQESSLGDILEGFKLELNSNKNVSFLEREGVTLNVIKLHLRELPIYAKYLTRYT